MDNDTLMIIVVVVLAMMLMKGNMLSNLFGCRENYANYYDSPHCATACANRVGPNGMKDLQCERNCQAEYNDCRNKRDGPDMTAEQCKTISSDSDPFNYYN